MTSLLFAVSLSALLSGTSLLVVLLRVSPLTAPAQAIPAFLVSVFLTVASAGMLMLYGIWTHVPTHDWDAGKIISVALREGVLLGLACVCTLTVAMLGLLTWWIVLGIWLVFGLIEVAMHV